MIIHKTKLETGGEIDGDRLYAGPGNSGACPAGGNHFCERHFHHPAPPGRESLEVLGAQLNKLADRQELNPLTVLSLDMGKEKS